MYRRELFKPGSPIHTDIVHTAENIPVGISCARSEAFQ